VALLSEKIEVSAAKGREMAAALVRAGFSHVRVETMRLKPAVVCALGLNGAGRGLIAEPQRLSGDTCSPHRPTVALLSGPTLLAR
jgi:hypothetical protein